MEDCQGLWGHCLGFRGSGLPRPEPLNREGLGVRVYRAECRGLRLLGHGDGRGRRAPGRVLCGHLEAVELPARQPRDGEGHHLRKAKLPG